MKSKFWLLAVGMVGACGLAHAEEGVVSTTFSSIANSREDLSWALATGFESRHIGATEPLNEHNRGIGIRAPGGWMLGGYYNSYSRYSVYLGREFQWRMLGEGDSGLNFGVVAGAVSGYVGGLHGSYEHGIHLMALPEIVAVSRYAEVSLMYIPELTKTPATLALQLRIRWP